MLIILYSMVIMKIFYIVGAVSILAFHSKPAKDYREQSGIEVYVEQFSKQHKTWTEDNISVNKINRIFIDSLNNFYALHKDAFNNLVVRLESVLDSVNGKRMASFECWEHYVDNKKLSAHIYAYVPDSLKKLYTGNDYVINGTIEKFDIYHGAGYNKVDNSCDVGIITIQPISILHLKRRSKTGNHDY